MYNPVSTYRVQFNKDFTLTHLLELVPYFGKLGIRTIYASPIFKAVPGSMHGYDIVNPYVINPEIGTEDQLQKVIAALGKEGIGWIQDIVPNHMAFHHTNEWLMDVMEKGSMSVYATFFDITWAGDFFHARLMAPFLGSSLDEAIQSKALQLVLESGRLFLHYGEQFYPINSRTYETILKGNSDQTPFASITQFLEQLTELHQIDDHVQYAFRRYEIELQFASLMHLAETKDYVETCIERVNGSDELIKGVADNQFYRLCEWRETNTRINYRRFFLVNGLICVNMQSEQVFSQYHHKVKSFVDEGLFQGLRIDHIDGLYDSERYCMRLRDLVGPESYIVVEKILELGEQLPRNWPIQGTTGYDFLGTVNNLFTRNKAENKLSKFYSSLTSDRKPIAQEVEEKKTAILYQYMGGELENLYRFFMEIAAEEIEGTDVKSAIAEFLILCPIYRMYGNAFPLRKSEQQEIRDILNKARERRPSLIKPLNLLEKVLLQNTMSGDEDYNSRVLQFYQRCMQLTGPLMAKGVEDTLMYTYNRFLAHNEVGDGLDFFGLTVSEFHARMQERQERWPLTQNTTSTHDTKRGEDVRMRLNVLADLEDEWIALVQHWIVINSRHKSGDAPSLNDEYFIYQTLIGVYPNAPEVDFVPRLEEYFMKAFREAKKNSDWSDPNEPYELAVTAFVKKIIAEESDFRSSFLPFQQKVSDHGMINSLAQLILKFTCPGVPDTYQGTTSWDLSLVDPDNRKLVDYGVHKLDLIAVMNTLPSNDSLPDLWTTRADGRVKLYVCYALLQLRKTEEDLFLHGHYFPLEVKGAFKENCLAFARRSKGTWIVSVVPLNIARISVPDDHKIAVDWKDTKIILPGEAPLRWADILSGRFGEHKGEILLANILKEIPFAVLRLQEQPPERNAGILLPLASLPSSFGIGDMGKGARDFALSLSRGRQRIWQLLPLNATSQGVAYSPYSAYSAMAGNILLISLEDLTEMNLLEQDEIATHTIVNNSVIRYSKAENVKRKFLNAAWSRFKTQRSLPLQAEFDNFVRAERYWLEDFAQFELLKRIYPDQPWHQWPVPFKHRQEDALAELEAAHTDEINAIKWMQFIFYKQWNALRSYCHTLDIKLFGDLPFYVSLDSADVWANRNFFAVDDNGFMEGVAGVPPDYFSQDGQLWGMPVFRWDVLRENNYDWWVNRISRNLDLYDLLRLDHFRAFDEYWEVPGSDKTAVNGTWKKGPGIDLFNTLKNKLKDLPLIAEDLGDITASVFSLRDKLGLPGMKVLQFAFGKDIGETLHIPHRYIDNFFVYTGTHDNNTTRGWYRSDIGEIEKANLKIYCGVDVKEKTVTDQLIRLAYISVAKTAIIPLQDVLNLDERSRTNTPSMLKSNWQWRMEEPLDRDIEDKLCRLTRISGR